MNISSIHYSGLSMINLYLLTKSAIILSFFEKINKSRTFALTIYNPNNYRTILAEDSEYFFAYIDISSFSVSEQKKVLNYISHQRKFDYGVLDPENSIKDPGALFHRGASDYIPGRALNKKITTQRIKQAVDFYSIEEAEEDMLPAEPEEITTGTTWDTIVEGNSYTFILLFIEIDMIEEWVLHSGKKHINTVMDHFYRHLEKIITPLHGRIWIKTEYGALVLIPYAGSSTPVIIECFKLQLNKTIISAEEYPFKTILSYKIALDIGTTQYLARGNTGNIISDSINYIFHLGHQYAEAGNFYLTKRTYDDIPQGLLEFFTVSGNFQNKTIYKMRQPLSK